MAGVVTFMENPLVIWIQTFNPGSLTLDFLDLTDSVFLNDVFVDIIQGEASEDLHRDAKDANAKLQNWEILMKNIITYYQEMLQQLIVMTLPDIVSIAKEPSAESSINGLKKILHLLLGIAVQCERKEDFIQVITGMKIKNQEKIASLIQEITENPGHVIPMDSDLTAKDSDKITKSLIKERDKCYELVYDLVQERDYCRAETEAKKGPLTPPSKLEKYHLHKELTECRSKIGRVMEELEEKQKVCSDLSEELSTMKEGFNKTKTENMNLVKDARAARRYRDELDVCQEKVIQVEHLEKELEKYKEKQHEMDFLKSRVEELRRDNDLLLESKSKLENVNSMTQRRMDSLMDEIVRNQLQLEEVTAEKDQSQQKMHALLEENASLEFERTTLKEGSMTRMRRMLSYPSSEFLTRTNSSSLLQLHGSGKPISDEINNSAMTQASQLEVENMELMEDLEETKNRLADAQRENKTLKVTAEKEMQEKVRQLEIKTKELKEKNSNEMFKDYEKKIIEIEKQNKSLKTKVDQEYQQRIRKFEKENTDLKNQVNLLELSWAKDKILYQQLEKLNKDLTAEKIQFKQAVETIRQCSEKKIQKLEGEVTAFKSHATSLQTHNNKIRNLCDTDINEDNVFYAAMEAQRESERDQGQRSSQSTPTRQHSGSFDTQSQRSLRSSSDYNPGPGVVMREKSGRGHIQAHVRPMSHTPTNPRLQRSSSHRSSFQGQGNVHVQGPDFPTTSSHSTIFGTMPRKGSAPQKGIVAPRRRSDSPDTLTDQNQSTFRRNDRMRATMPERRSMNVTPTVRSDTESMKSYDPKTRSLNDSYGYNESFESCNCDDTNNNKTTKRNGSSTPSQCHSNNNNTPHRHSNHSHGSHRHSNRTSSSNSDHMMTSFSVFSSTSSETIKTQIRNSGLPKMGEKWKALVDRIVSLQDSNQQLILENSELRKTISSVKFSVEKIDGIEKRNIELELENRKLHKIVETLQASLSGPYDKREYHYFSNV